MSPLPENKIRRAPYQDVHLHLDFEEQVVRMDAQRLTLTRKEFELLALLALPYVFPWVKVDSFTAALIAALALGLVNTLIRPVLIAALMLRSLDNLKEFDMIYTITQGGPGIASETLYLYSYNVGFSFFKAGYGSALMVVVFMIVLAFNVVMNRLRREAPAV